MQRTKGIPDAINASITKNFTQVPNELLRNPDISFKAKGLLCLLLSNKEGWHSYITTIRQMTSEGVSAIQSGIAELEKAGYLLRVHDRDKYTKVRRGSFWAYADIPGNFNMGETIQTLNNKNLEVFIFSKNLPENPYIENLDIGNQDIVNQSLIILYNNNTKNKNTNFLSEETSDEEISSLNGELSLKEKNLPYIPFMEKLLTIVQSKKNIRIKWQQKEKWATEIRLLAKKDGVSPNRIQKALDWYSEHIGGEFCPEIESGNSLRSKFLRLEAAMKREGKSKFPKLRQAVRMPEGKHYPKGKEHYAS